MSKRPNRYTASTVSLAKPTCFATPTAEGQVIGHYGPETEVAVIGTVAGADYYYVSPCNACDSGFVPRAAVRPFSRDPSVDLRCVSGRVSD